MEEKISFYHFCDLNRIIIFVIILLFLTTIPTVALEIVSIPVTKTENNIYQIEAEIPILMNLNHKNIQKKYNDLFRDNIMTFIEYTVAMAKQSYRDFNESGFPWREFVGRVNFETKNTEQILSIKFNYYQYTGGAHGNPYSLSYNIDLATGKDLKLVDFLERHNMSLSEVEKLIKAAIKKDPDIYFEADYGFQTLDKNQFYYLEDGDLVIYFQPYAIAPYSTGIPEFRIKY